MNIEEISLQDVTDASSNSTETSECIICLEKLRTNLRIYECGHIVHNNCYIELRGNGYTRCTICNKDAQSDTISDIDSLNSSYKRINWGMVFLGIWVFVCISGLIIIILNYTYNFIY